MWREVTMRVTSSITADVRVMRVIDGIFRKVQCGINRERMKNEENPTCEPPVDAGLVNTTESTFSHARVYRAMIGAPAAGAAPPATRMMSACLSISARAP